MAQEVTREEVNRVIGIEYQVPRWFIKFEHWNLGMQQDDFAERVAKRVKTPEFLFHVEHALRRVWPDGILSQKMRAAGALIIWGIHQEIWSLDS